jgi:hypothetical protein
MLKNLFRRAAVADLNTLTYVEGGYGTSVWYLGDGQDLEGYKLEKDNQSGHWDLVHFSYAKNETGKTTIATIPRLEDAVVILRSLLEQKLKPSYAGIANAWFDDRTFSESTGDHSLRAVERALELRQ